MGEGGGLSAERHHRATPSPLLSSLPSSSNRARTRRLGRELRGERLGFSAPLRPPTLMGKAAASPLRDTSAQLVGDGGDPLRLRCLEIERGRLGRELRGFSAPLRPPTQMGKARPPCRGTLSWGLGATDGARRRREIPRRLCRGASMGEHKSSID
ncbi:hypothetical protein PAHAL_9G624900 [Panicum hallii]|uniref:Uncharacterized protein n=1 Tax=Panicum hallii TaxID=206008 RepID=A0A2S3IV01_9POAL|nr:hypothetical protein PAHAL_9G624900 [Panicum hallii]